MGHGSEATAAVQSAAKSRSGVAVRDSAARRALARPLRALLFMLGGLVLLTTPSGCHLIVPYSTNGSTGPSDGRTTDASRVADARTDVGSANDGRIDGPLGAACHDGLQNGDETDVDCGGQCLACDGAPCIGDQACRSGKCSVGGFCLTNCHTWGPFSALIAIDAVNDDLINQAPEITLDGLTLLLCSNGDLLMSTRTSLQAPFETPFPVPGIPTEGFQDDPTITGDGLELFYAIRKPSDGLRTTRRDSTDSIWGGDFGRGCSAQQG